MKNLVVAAALAFAVAGVSFLPSANASSNFTSGEFTEFGPAGSDYRDLGTCQFLTGPRGGIPAGRFLMTIGDRHSVEEELRVTGQVTTSVSDISGNLSYRLFPDDTAAAGFFQEVLRRQQHDPKLTLSLYSFDAGVEDVYGPNSEDQFLCHASLTGRVEGGTAGSAPVSLSFRGGGQFLPGIDTKPAPAKGNPAGLGGDDPCATALQAPDGLDPVPGKCSTPQCLLDFKGYKWWTSFNFRGASFPDKSYYWNDALKTAFAPKNAFVDGEGLHLMIANQDLGAGPVTAGAEVVALFNADSTEANLGYGEYLVTATVKTAGTWDTLDPNVAFGAFNFERLGTGGGTGTVDNPNRETDLAELSRFGWPAGDPQCPSEANPPQICTGNAQFTLQDWSLDAANNVHRYSIAANAKTVTLVMKWTGANVPVTFREYDGTYDFSNLPAAPNNEWTTSAAQNRFIPANSCQRFHLNLWLGNFRAEGAHPPPQTVPYEVVVTNFQFQPGQ